MAKLLLGIICIIIGIIAIVVVFTTRNEWNDKDNHSLLIISASATVLFGIIILSPELKKIIRE